MQVPRLTDLAATVVPDQIGKSMLVVMGVDVHGTIWIKQGPAKWQKLSREAVDSEQ